MRTLAVLFVLLTSLWSHPGNGLDTSTAYCSIDKADINGDKEINERDKELLEYCLAESSQLPDFTYCTIEKADINGDKTIDTLDLDLIRECVKSFIDINNDSTLTESDVRCMEEVGRFITK